MIHERHEAHVEAREIPRRLVQHIGRADLAPEMREVLGAQEAARLGAFDRLAKREKPGAQRVAVGVVAGAQAVENRRDAGAGDLRVIAVHGRDRIPPHAGARGIMRLQMIGVQLHETRNQDVVAERQAGSVESAFLDADDHAVLDMNHAGDLAIGQHDAPRVDRQRALFGGGSGKVVRGANLAPEGARRGDVVHGCCAHARGVIGSP